MEEKIDFEIFISRWEKLSDKEKDKIRKQMVKLQRKQAQEMIDNLGEYFSDNRNDEKVIDRGYDVVIDKPFEKIVDNGTQYTYIKTPKNWKCKRRGCKIDFQHFHATFPSLDTKKK